MQVRGDFDLKIRLTFLVAAMLLGVNALRAQEDVAETTAQPKIDESPIVETPITAADREHWAFRPVTRPTLPEVSDKAWARGGIDALILAKLQQEGIQPAGQARRPTLLRRLTFDLTGLPPTPEQLAAFEADQSPDAYERLTDRLLASPAYGERWAQHWLDLARFAETDGFEHDKVRPQAWKYRDWVIGALNADLPYDQFIRQQVAGDLKAEDRGQKTKDRRQEAGRSANSAIRNPQSAIPTAFCLAGPDMPDINDQVERRHIVLNEMTATVGSVLLGLQMGCAQCHDHKYDPLSQADFYRLRAVFESAVPPLKRDAPYNFLAEQKDAPPARFWIRGDHRRPGIELKPAFPRVVTRSPAIDEPHSALRTPRSALVDWLFSPDNPLPARVIVNRLWQQHFGRGIFDTPSDVGLINAGPTHPELLDWLASEMQEGDWSLKRMHRLLLNSASYRQIAAHETPQSAIRNPQFLRRRLDGEAIRDAMLSAAGLLSSERGGPGVMPPLPPELVGTLLKGQWQESPDEADHYRRSIYVFARRNLRYPIFEAFDRPDANASCPVRNRSTTAPQSLVLLNSDFSLLAARHVAGRVRASGVGSRVSVAGSQDTARQIEQLYVIALARRPSEREVETLSAFLAQQRQRLAGEARPATDLALPAGFADGDDPYAAAALVDACLALLNASEFLYVD